MLHVDPENPDAPAKERWNPERHILIEDARLLKRDVALGEAEAHLKGRGIVGSGDIYAITCGDAMGVPGGTNMLKICRAS